MLAGLFFTAMEMRAVHAPMRSRKATMIHNQGRLRRIPIMEPELGVDSEYKELGLATVELS